MNMGAMRDYVGLLRYNFRTLFRSTQRCANQKV